MRALESADARFEPELGKVRRRRDMNLVTALQVEHGGDGGEVFEGGFKMGECRGERWGGFQARAPAHQKIDAEIILQRLDPLAHGRRGNRKRICGRLQGA